MTFSLSINVFTNDSLPRILCKIYCFCDWVLLVLEVLKLACLVSFFKGKCFNTIHKDFDIDIKVGDKTCIIINMTQTVISCVAPTVKPRVTSGNKHLEIRVSLQFFNCFFPHTIILLCSSTTVYKLFFDQMNFVPPIVLRFQSTIQPHHTLVLFGYINLSITY
jgi:hypothetical protein